MKNKVLFLRQGVYVLLLCLFNSLAFGQSTAFITKWQAFEEQEIQCDTPFDCYTVTNPANIIIPTVGGGYNYSLSWTNLTNPGVMNGSANNLTGDYVIWNLESGSVYEVAITGSFPRIFLGVGGPNSANAEKLLSIEQWGNIVWSSMDGAFSYCTNMVYNALDVPNLTNVSSLRSMFQGCTSFPGSNLNINFNNWNTQNVTDMSSMFENAINFNRPIGNWSTQNVTNMNAMFKGATSYNQSLQNWNVSNVSNMMFMFLGATNFNQAIGNWNTSNVTNMRGMFGSSNFNQPIGNWNTNSVTSMHEMFAFNSNFNQPINTWNTSNVNITHSMFSHATSFNQPIGNWNMSNVNNMNAMFLGASSFNHPLNGWNVSNVQSMQFMFQGSTNFNQNLGSWNLTVSSPTGLLNMLSNSGLSCANYSSTLIGWANNPLVPNNRSIDALGLSYGVNAASARAILTGTKGWTITGDAASGTSCTTCSVPTNSGYDVITSCTAVTWINGITYTSSNNSATHILTGAAANGCDSLVTLNLTITQCQPFVTRWSTQDMDWDAYYFDGSWIPAAPYIKISTAGSVPYNYNIVWENMDNPGLGDGSASGLTGPYTITGLNWGDVYQVSISGDFPRFYIAPSPNVFDGQKLLSIEQWGDIVWYNMEEAFSGCINMQYNATDTPNLTNVTNMKDMFSYCSSMTGNNTINNWNTESITNMSAMFKECTQFNQPTGNWDVSSVQDMGQMFNNATAFNQPLNGWDVSSVIEMGSMFSGASSFNQPLNNWNTSSLMYAASMFSYGSIFNQPINNWDVSNLTTMQFMFAQNTSFNQALNNWDVTSVTNINNMFQNASAFNQPLNSWNTSNMVSMFNVFQNATSFNQPLNNWNVSNVANLNAMFQNASSFNQNLGSWTLANNANITFMLHNSGLNCQNYSETLQGWANNPSTPNNRSLGALGRTYGTDAAAARAILTGTKGWTIAGDIAGATNCLSTPPQGQITNLLCSSASHAGNLIENVNANAVSSTVSYTGGNGVAHSGQVVSSTGVTGLTATLAAGTLNNGNGTFTYVITGTPSASGTANFALNIGGQTCTLQVAVAVNPYPAGTVFCNGAPTPVVEVTNPATGRKWMDRNLGANQVSTSSTNATSYGDLYQWGRGADGHQCRNSVVTYGLSSNDQPSVGNFIATQLAPSNIGDWRSPQNDNLWQGVNGVNNPCPSGFRIPTEVEFQQEIQTWSSNNAAGAYASPLKWSLAGLRGNANGTLFNVNQLGHYWSSTVNGTNASYLWFNNTQALTVSYYRAYGFSIRCIKEVPPPSYGVDVINSCPPFIWIDGNSYNTSNNTATHTIPSGAANGGDSIVTLNLTIVTCSQLTTNFCNATNVGANTDVAATNVAGAQSYRFRIVGNNVGNNWANNTIEHISNDRFFRFNEINGIMWGQTYTVEVAVSMDGMNYGFYGNLCTITLANIPTTAVSTNTCNLGTVGGGHNISVNNVIGALGYRFRIVGNNTANWPASTLEFINGTNSFQFNSVNGLIWGQTYAIQAAVLSQDGVTYGNYGAVCSLTFTSPAPTLISTFCNMTGVGLNTAIRSNNIANATGYLFRITGPNSGTSNWVGGSALLFSPTRAMKFADVPGVLAGQTYQIEVAVRAQDGITYGPFGPACSVTLSNVLMQEFVSENETKEIPFEAIASHNPFTESFGLQVVTDKIDEWVYITIYDMSGKQIEQQQLAPLDVENAKFGSNLASGMYMIEVRQGANQAVIRQVKN